MFVRINMFHAVYKKKSLIEQKNNNNSLVYTCQQDFRGATLYLWNQYIRDEFFASLCNNKALHFHV